jgi:hypothetical protein
MISGKRGWLWRAVDDAGEVLDILVQRRRSALAARRFFRKLLKGLQMVPSASVTEVCKGLRACGTRRASVLCSVRSATSFGPATTRSLPQLSDGDAPALAGMGHRLGDDGVRYRSVRSVSAETSAVVTSLFNA